MESEPDSRIVDQLLGSLDTEDRAAALRVLEREALRTAPEILNSGKKKVLPEEPLKEDSRRPMDHCPI